MQKLQALLDSLIRVDLLCFMPHPILAFHVGDLFETTTEMHPYPACVWVSYWFPSFCLFSLQLFPLPVWVSASLSQCVRFLLGGTKRGRSLEILTVGLPLLLAVQEGKSWRVPVLINPEVGCVCCSLELGAFELEVLGGRRRWWDVSQSRSESRVLWE